MAALAAMAVAAMMAASMLAVVAVAVPVAAAAAAATAAAAAAVAISAAAAATAVAVQPAGAVAAAAMEVMIGARAAGTMDRDGIPAGAVAATHGAARDGSHGERKGPCEGLRVREAQQAPFLCLVGIFRRPNPPNEADGAHAGLLNLEQLNRSAVHLWRLHCHCHAGSLCSRLHAAT